LEARYRYLHLHGFASSHRSRKGLHLQAALASAGVRLELPDLNRPSFEQLTYDAALAHLDQLATAQSAAGDDRRWRLSGSSLGGYLALRWAALRPELVERLALLCPAFALPGRWEALLGTAALRRWEQQGTLPLPDALGQPRPVHWELVRSARRHPARPNPPCPTLLIHGRDDEVLPLGGSQAYAAEHPERVQLVEVPGDHSLAAALPELTQQILDFYGLGAAGPTPSAPPEVSDDA